MPSISIFTQAKNINAIVGDPRPPSSSEREKWVVILEGRFVPGKAPPGATSMAVYSRFYAIIDATEGELASFVLRDQIGSIPLGQPGGER